MWFSWAPTGKAQGPLLNIEADEVRLDATVLDKNRHPVTNLSAGEFALYHNNQRQKIVSCQYAEGTNGPRTIVFVVDDLSMSFDEFQRSRGVLRRFVEFQKLPGDRVAIVQTGGGAGALQQFSSDTKRLLRAVRDMRWGDAASNSGCGYDDCAWEDDELGPYNFAGYDAQYPDANDGRRLSGSLSKGFSLEAAQNLRIKRNALRAFGAQFATVQFCVAALRQMPGRKQLLLMSSRTQYGKRDLSVARWTTNTVQSTLLPYFYALADAAFRSAVAIHTLEMRPGRLQADVRPPYDKYLPYSRMTGGMIAGDGSFAAGEIGPLKAQSEGFYLISYVPPPATFKPDRGDRYNLVRITVRGSGHTVLHRECYRGAATSSLKYPVAREGSLQQAISNPLLNNGVEVRLNAAFSRASKPGFQLRTRMHLDATPMVFVQNKNGTRSCRLEFVATAFDMSGDILDSKGKRYDFELSDEEYSRIQTTGIDLETYLFVKDSGGFYVRGTVRDSLSGKSGSAYQYLEIPYIREPRLVLSSVFAPAGPDEASMLLAGNAGEDKSPFGPGRPIHKAGMSPAVRRFQPGDSFDYMAIIYNAKTKEDGPPQLESRVTLTKDGKEYLRGESEVVDLRSIGDFGRIPIRKSFVVRDDMESGDYVLRLTITDKQVKDNLATAFQSIGFEVRRSEDSSRKIPSD